jgi:septal ring-binding cell division protein DamX
MTTTIQCGYRGWRKFRLREFRGDAFDTFRTQQHSKAMKALPLIAVGLLVTACSGQGQRPAASSANPPETGKWFCQMNPSGASWECVEDPQLARNPKPTRIPQPATPATQQPESSVWEDDQPALESERAPDPPAPDGQSPRGATNSSTSQPAPMTDDLPEYVRLAHQPAASIPLTELPGTFYAVQLIALPSQAALDDFVSRHGIRGTAAARVESGGSLYYVLLLGVYESMELAERAIAAMPNVPGAQPWIRPLGSLQSAMLRADSLAGSVPTED